MSGGIYLETARGGRLVEMTQQPYESEDRLQAFLETHPKLLGGEQINPAAPRRWLLISREMGVPGEEQGPGRWKMDHMFVDQDAIPTLVEVKRSSNTQIRREIVGQMLDYAANGTAYWKPGTLQAAFAATCRKQTPDREPDDALREFLGPGTEPSDFWQSAEKNLAEGTLRLLFVADRIPPELRRIVEFLNSQMKRTEVLAIEITQYVGEDMSALVPRVIGQTIDVKPGGSKPRIWDLASLLDKLRNDFDTRIAEVACKIHDEAERRAPDLQVRWGRGAVIGNFSLTYAAAGGRHTLVYVETNGSVTDLNISGLQAQPVFASEAARTELLDQFRRVPGVAQQLMAGKTRPDIPLSALLAAGALDAFWEAVDWVLARLRSSPVPGVQELNRGGPSE